MGLPAGSATGVVPKGLGDLSILTIPSSAKIRPGEATGEITHKARAIDVAPKRLATVFVLRFTLLVLYYSIQLLIRAEFLAGSQSTLTTAC
jgi:hypothetical protein